MKVTAISKEMFTDVHIIWAHGKQYATALTEHDAKLKEVEYYRKDMINCFTVLAHQINKAGAYPNNNIRALTSKLVEFFCLEQKDYQDSVLALFLKNETGKQLNELYELIGILFREEFAFFYEAEKEFQEISKAVHGDFVQPIIDENHYGLRGKMPKPY